MATHKHWSRFTEPWTVGYTPNRMIQCHSAIICFEIIYDGSVKRIMQILKYPLLLTRWGYRNMVTIMIIIIIIIAIIAIIIIIAIILLAIIAIIIIIIIRGLNSAYSYHVTI